MTILNVQVDNIGQSGVVPRFIYIDTSDSISQVTQTGYLNSVVNQGTAISVTDMALVITQTASSPRATQVSLYNVIFSGGEWSLTQMSSGVAAGINLGAGTGIYAGVSGSNLEFYSLVATSGAGISALSVSSNEIAFAIDQSAAFNPTWLGNQKFAGTFSLTGLSSITTDNVLFYNTTSGLVSFGPNSAFNTAGTYILTGGWTFEGSFTVNNGSSGILLNSTGNVDIDGDNTYVYATVRMTIDAADILIGTSDAVSITIGYTGGDGIGQITMGAGSITATANEIFIGASSSVAVTIGSNTTVAVTIGSTAVTALTIIGGLSADPGGSLAVMWNATTQTILSCLI